LTFCLKLLLIYKILLSVYIACDLTFLPNLSLILLFVDFYTLNNCKKCLKIILKPIFSDLFHFFNINSTFNNYILYYIILIGNTVVSKYIAHDLHILLICFFFCYLFIPMCFVLYQLLIYFFTFNCCH